MALVLISFVSLFGLVASIGLLLFYRDAVLDRLTALVSYRQAPSANGLGRLMRANPAASVETLVKPFQNVLPRSPQEVSVIQKRLIRAGYRDSSYVNFFYSCKVAVPLALTLLASISRAYEFSAFFVYAVTLGIGFLAPDFWVGSRISRRQSRLARGLPEALDLMVICSEAGLGLDQTLKRVAEELKLSQPELSDELALVNLEQRAGRPRDQSLRNLGERTNVETIKTFVNTLIQADTYGTSIAKTLRVYAETLRTHRRQQAEEQAAKTTVKLVFPLVLFIFPSLFVVALGPAMITLFEGFDKYLLSGT